MIKNKYAIYKRSKHNECVSTQDRVLRLLYGNGAGRMVLGWLIRPEVSKLVGRFMDTGLSRIMINPFIKKNDIDISVCQKNEFDSYNDFFKRKLVPGARAIDITDEGFVSPCDSRLTVYDIEDTERQTFNIKDSEWHPSSGTKSLRDTTEVENCGCSDCVSMIITDTYITCLESSLMSDV